MRKTILIVAVLSCFGGAALAATVYCPLHSYASCYDTGELSATGSNAHKWHCTCGDDVWVAPEADPGGWKKREAEERAEDRNKRVTDAVDRNTKAIKDAAWEAKVAAMDAATRARIAEDEAILARKSAPVPKPSTTDAPQPMTHSLATAIAFPLDPTGEDLLRVCEDDSDYTQLVCFSFITGVMQATNMGPGELQFNIAIPNHTKFLDIKEIIIKYIKTETLFLDGPQAAAKRVDAAAFIRFALISRWPIKQ